MQYKVIDGKRLNALTRTKRFKDVRYPIRFHMLDEPSMSIRCFIDIGDREAVVEIPIAEFNKLPMAETEE